ncbi:peptide chain release factor N(5)-glutamine methyltransferase [Novosphingobium sp. PASSN1]|uniref:peptide chain release factor N(5)-glutamine methyltransferase n=1 Tax=Novosphingobium sp. PASSN1 TaxID=2015561 RepID=UPI000BD5B48B|nr:peptide chain release factor N(5)-glutamine methyltransferase [Novosphingobium sp. PASSN1]OYU36493.1 MAG: protein-(glutamine-N5) methyltransferase, release factor-specific [Novosphingobium sp. PASSN1]
MPDTVRAALREAAERLAATSDTARLDAELLMAHALGVSRTELLLRHMDGEPPAGLTSILDRRLSHEPIAYILGTQPFYGLDLEVSPAVLIPRGDSETLIEVARTAREGRPPSRILDLGTGSGALLLAALSVWPEAEGIGLERSAAARAVAARNAATHGLAARAQIIAGDWTQTDWAAELGRFDLILANPPYVETEADLAPSVRAHEPAEALFAGPDGLGDYRRLIPEVPHLLAPGGMALFEIGLTQGEAVAVLAREAGLGAQIHHDLAGRPRSVEMA